MIEVAVDGKKRSRVIGTCRIQEVSPADWNSEESVVFLARNCNWKILGLSVIFKTGRGGDPEESRHVVFTGFVDEVTGKPYDVRRSFKETVPGTVVPILIPDNCILLQDTCLFVQAVANGKASIWPEAKVQYTAQPEE